MLVEAVGLNLLFNRGLDVRPLGRHFLPRTTATATDAFVMAGTALANAPSPRHHPGQFWSGRITLRQDHQFIRTGPYARLQHPLYTGFDVAALGTAVVLDHWRSVAGVCVI